MRIVKGRAPFEHQIAQGPAVLQPHVGHDAAVAVFAFDSGGEQTDFLTFGQSVQFLPGFAGVKLGLPVVPPQLRRVDARQTHHAPVRKFESVTVEAAGHHAFRLGQGVFLRPRRRRQKQAAEQEKQNGFPRMAGPFAVAEIRCTRSHFTFLCRLSK